MREDEVRVHLAESQDLIYDESEHWALFDSDDVFFQDERNRMTAVPSENGDYLAAYSGSTQHIRNGEVMPAGFCLIRENRVCYAKELGSVEPAIPANDGTVVAATADFDKGHMFYVFNRYGEILIEETFESAPSALAISPEGQFAAIATAFPDNAVHIYEVPNQRYLGRNENSLTSVLMHIEFQQTEDGLVVATYQNHPDSSLDIDPARKQVVDTFPTTPAADTLEFSGIGIAMNDDCWHHVSDDEIANVDGALRVPGVVVQTTCGTEVEPLYADTVYENSTTALESGREFCPTCKKQSVTYPSEKTEKNYP